MVADSLELLRDLLLETQAELQQHLSLLLSLFRSLPAFTQYVLAVNLAVYLLWKLSPSLATRHFTSSSLSLSGRRLHTLVTSAFSHRSVADLVFNVYWFAKMLPALRSVLGDSLLGPTLLLSALVSSLFPLLTDALTRVLHRGHTLNKQSQAMRSYSGMVGVNIALLYLSLSLQPDLVFSLDSDFFERDFPLQTVFGAAMAFDLLGLLVDMFVIPSAQSISHASHVGGLLAGMLIQYLFCETQWGRGQLRWNNRYAMCKRLW